MTSEPDGNIALLVLYLDPSQILKKAMIAPPCMHAVGSCCWPVLLAGIIGITATAQARVVSHTFSLALTMTILTNLCQFMAHKAAARK